MENINLFQLLFVIVIIVSIEELFFTYKFYNYTKKKYPKIGKVIKNSLFTYDDIPYYKQIFHNSHPNDKKYSFYISMSRINLVVIIMLFALTITLMFI
ncbi:Uncharacterised protein [uncultured archaeon]|nr:Uncharacterised protein [uncultured archaeon]